jgi:membrane protein YqaA with SNARE-associated domain
MLRRLYDYIIDLASRPRALWALAAVSFAESSFFPIPPDAMVIPMALARPDRGWRIATVCTVASVLGGILGYAIGYFLYETIGVWLVSVYHYENAMEQFREAYARWGLWIILIKGLTPIPYKLVTIASGVARFDFTVFVLASIVTRGLRFFLVVALIKRFGAPIRDFIERYLTWVTTGFVVCVAGGFVLVRYAF